jgi:hypothetical protein
VIVAIQFVKPSLKQAAFCHKSGVVGEKSNQKPSWQRGRGRDSDFTVWSNTFKAQKGLLLRPKLHKIKLITPVILDTYLLYA